jgi:hypothetical protein
MSRRCTFGEFESLAAPLWVALRALMGFILLASRRKFKGVEERKGGDCRDPTPKNMGKLMLL